jgi:hypothetical protein
VGLSGWVSARPRSSWGAPASPIGVLSFCVQKVPVQEALKVAGTVRKLWIQETFCLVRHRVWCTSLEEKRDARLARHLSRIARDSARVERVRVAGVLHVPQHGTRPGSSAAGGPALELGLALHIGFVRTSGRPLDAFRVLPVALLRHLGRELDIPSPTSRHYESCPAAAARTTGTL